MDDLWQGMIAALRLIGALDADLFEIIGRSLYVTLSATLIASAIGLPLGAWLAVSRFRQRRTVISLLNALMGCRLCRGLDRLPLFSRAGRLAFWGCCSRPR